MPIVHFLGRSISCERKARLRSVLLAAGVSPHRGPFKLLNCHGLGSCGTCAVRVEGDVSRPGLLESARLLFARRGVRLACKVRVLGDVRVTRP